jgi:hypothetical protein
MTAPRYRNGKPHWIAAERDRSATCSSKLTPTSALQLGEIADPTIYLLIFLSSLSSKSIFEIVVVGD